jgi:hypothetical protein
MLSVAISFLRIVATAKTGGTLTVYSPRFSYSGMTGTFKDNVLTGMKSVKGTDGPPSEDTTTKDGAAANPDAELFDVEYTMQTGPTRYAPMQPVPPTKITKKDATPQYPTSSVDIARTILPIPKIQTTITQSQTHKVSSMANTVRCGCVLSRDCGSAAFPLAATVPYEFDGQAEANLGFRLLRLPCLPMTWLNSSQDGKIRLEYISVESTA